MLYFAYGSNMDAEQMKSRCPGHRVVGLAELRDHRLTFPLTSHSWGGGVASVSVAHGESVWGVVYDLTDADVAELDRYEGYRGPGNAHNLYDRETVTVHLTRADDGSFPRKLHALIYIARTANPGPAVAALPRRARARRQAPPPARGAHRAAQGHADGGIERRGDASRVAPCGSLVRGGRRRRQRVGHAVQVGVVLAHHALR
jgi:gamma-glutamylcyclotransferase (GGCT)/AIG2-like uncharacterized protein YtfP